MSDSSKKVQGFGLGNQGLHTYLCVAHRIERYGRRWSHVFDFVLTVAV